MNEPKRLLSFLAPAMLGLGLCLGAPAVSAQPRATELPLSMRMPSQRFALVIGSNATLDASADPLRFADDDAASMAELLAEVGYDVALVTTLDAETQALHPDLVRRAIDPSPEGLETAWADLKGRMDAARGEVELLIYYSGHGDVGPDGQGYLTLSGGKLTRNKLFAEILSTSPADHNHVLIDACRSEQFVLTRGKTWKEDRTGDDASADVGQYLGKNHLGGHPDTGVIVAHSADQQTHEWERYRGGIFTHQLLSGLRGGADLNGDGAVEYSELGAFVAAANSGVKDPRARLDVTVRPPAEDQRRPVLRHEGIAKERVLYFPAGEDQRLYTLEDTRGVRLADLRRAGDQPGYLRLPDGDVFVSRRTADGSGDAQEATIPADARGMTTLPELAFSRTQRASRGALDQAFRAGLFATPYGPGYYSGYTDTRGLLAVEDPTWRVEVWEVDEDGTETKVSETEVEAPSADEALETEIVRTEEDDDEEQVRTYWGSVFLGTVLTPMAPSGQVRGSPRRVIEDRARACLQPSAQSACSPLRGFDIRWQLFSVKGKGHYPRWTGFLRLGYEGGRIDFVSPDGEPLPFKSATSLSYVKTPLWFGANVYFFERFPLRPYGGLGVGGDGLRLRYTRQDAGRLLKQSGRGNIGFEVHGGLEVRITNWVALSAEVRQAWVTRNRFANLPDLSTQGVSIITGVAIGFPLREEGRRRKVRTEVRSTTVKKKVTPNPMKPPEAPKAPEPPPPVQAPADVPDEAPAPAPAPPPGPAPE